MSIGTSPSRQTSWDARAAANFICGGAGAGLIVFTALTVARDGALTAAMLAGVALIGTGLLCVWHELGRPLRALHVFFHPRTSWMTRESFVATLLVPVALVAATGVEPFAYAAGVLAAAFIVCQARMLQASCGIPAWREPLTAALLAITALTEGAGIWLALSPWLRTGSQALVAAFGVLVLGRIVVWLAYRRAVAVASPRSAAALVATGRVLQVAGTLLPLVAVAAIVGGVTSGSATLAVAAAAGALGAAAGAHLKYVLVVHAGFTQGPVLTRLPVRGVPRVRPERI
jgi:phenylacetyl-CoA:acceptor oxidoreductase 26-kDa subunit